MKLMHKTNCIILSSAFFIFLMGSLTLRAEGNGYSFPSATVAQQDLTVSGVISDEKGEPLVGASIQIVGTTIGAVTDWEGKFSIQVPEKNSKLSFSYIGYKAVTVDVNGQSSLNVTLESTMSDIDEVVVIGYGTAKKRDLIGAVDQVTSETLESRATPSITRSLQGQIPNLNISMRDGKPNRETSYNVRGETSIGAGGNALILIDGVEGDPSTLNPQDVESVSVLKDASSAAVYGARGTFGVVLITTKKAGKGKLSVNYDGSASFLTRTVKPSFVTNGYEWTTSFLDAYYGYNDYSASDPTSINNVFPFSRSWYEELKRRNDNPELPRVRVNSDGNYEYFGNTDWNQLLYKDWTQGTDHKLSINGGNDVASYYVSGRFFAQDGIYRYNSDDLKRYNFRAKGQIKVSPKLTIDNNFSMDNNKYHYPLMSYADELVQRNLEHQGYPMALMFNPDGTYTYSSIYNGVGDFHNETSFQDDNTLNVRNTVGATYTPVKDVLTFKGDFTYSYKDYQRTRVNRYAPYSEGPGQNAEKGQSLRRMWNQETNYFASNLTGNYTPNLGENHSLNILVGGNVESSTRRNIYNRRDGYLYPDKPNFILMDGINYVMEERSIDWAFIGVFFRANYAYKGKYLFEVSSRYDGSSKFPTNEQWGIFPSASLGWRISDEGFMEGTKDWLDNLKLRASAGTLGNGNVSPYSYLQLMDVGKTSLLLDGGFQTYTDLPTLIPDNLTWEKSTTYDVGLDADLFKGRFNLGFDWYRRNTTDMYVTGPQLPQTLGANAPKGNYADLKTLGWELTIGWKNRFKLAGRDFAYNAKFMLWDSQSWITKYLGNENMLLSSYYEGQKLGDIWGYTVEGLFTSEEEIAAHADQSKIPVSKGKMLLPGDLKFKNLDDDDIIYRGANTLDDHGDLSIIGNELPRYQFGFNLGGNYCGFGLNAFFQGVGKKDWYPDIESGYFWGQYNRQYGYYPTDQVGNMWIEGVNEDPNAYWPRLRSYMANSSSKPMGVKNTRYLQNAAYVRLKSVTLDYTLPADFVSDIKLTSVKFYVTGENLWTWTGLTKHTTNFDPEVIESGDPDQASNSNRENGYSYPMLKSITFGVNIIF
ncbi:TonB-linked outer membrane protein, SusC/RagA family [Mariniphaga anaerophila]|uniref:TonB-linked outer membrane protein, SusC/RagA family n=2 Tax=Mariniphaga anaerophila TaxID=1484053 RepID=A0A1M4V670_9BACT|nr:TonB-linked outer membrane protein, SusC/RagA family [Mariniphaga anaerophila]